MFDQKKNLLAAALSAALLVTLAACSAPAPATSPLKDSTAAPAASATPTPTPDTSTADVDLLPYLDGVADAAPDGWSAGSCAGLTYAYPAGWTFTPEPTYQMFENEAEPALATTSEVSTDTLSQTITLSCGGKSDWDGSWDGTDAESYRLDIKGAKYAAVLVQPHLSAADVYMDGEYFNASIQILTSEQDYFEVGLTLPANGKGYDMVRAVASSLSIGIG